MFIVDIKLQRPSGEVVRVRKVPPVTSMRAARAYERELRQALLEGRPLPGEPAATSTPTPIQEEIAPEPIPAPASSHSDLAPAARPATTTTTEPPTTAPAHAEATAPDSPAIPTTRRRQRTNQPTAAATLSGPRPADEAPEVPTLAEFVPEFMRFQASPAASRRGANKPGELLEKRRLFDNHLLPAFGHLRLDQITARVIDRYIAAKTRPADAPRRRPGKLGEALAPGSVANHIAVLRRVLSVARRWELLDRVPTIVCPPVWDQRFDFLTFEETERFLAAAPADFRLLLFFAVRTGLRLGELRGLRWQDMRLDAGIIRVEQSLTKSGFGTPKSHKARTVELAPDLLAALREHPRTESPHGLVFCKPSGEPLREGQIYRAVQAAAKSAGLGRHVHPHMLRHTFASHCVMRGIPLAVVKEWLGHAESRMTERYAHLAPEIRSSFIDRLATGSRGNGSDNRPPGRGNIGATAEAQNGGTPSIGQ